MNANSQGKLGGNDFNKAPGVESSKEDSIIAIFGICLTTGANFLS